MMMDSMFSRIICVIAFAFSTAFSSCYTFSGASISPDVKTINIHTIPNQSSLVIPSLSQSFTEKLKDKFQTGTQLSLVNTGGDLEISGQIASTSVTPVAAQANQTAALNRLAISVSIDFKNHKDDKQSFSQTFSRYADFDSHSNLAAVQSSLIEEINAQLADDIFNKAVVNW